MKVAIVYDWLNQKNGGGEATLHEILKLYPNADLHCLIYNKHKFSKIASGHKVFPSRLQHFPSYLKKRPNLLLPFIRKAVNNMDFTDYDVVISVSSAWVKNISVPKGTKHICYCFSPARMIWDSWPQYLDTQKLGPLKIGTVSRFFILKSVSKIRLWDYYSTQGVDEFVAISQYISKRILKFYGRNSMVVYPPVSVPSTFVEPEKDDYYLVLSVLSRYKNIDLVVNAFKQSGRKLIIAGDGPDSSRLVQLAGSAANITFAGRVSDIEKARLFSKAKAFVFPSLEDFGITPVEALSFGTPVVALKGGGLTETIQDGVTGYFFTEPTVESMNEAFDRLEKQTFKAKRLFESAQKFSDVRFSKEFPDEISKLLKKGSHEKS